MVDYKKGVPHFFISPIMPDSDEFKEKIILKNVQT